MKKILMIGLGLMMFSCFEQGECSDISSNLLLVGFYNYPDRQTKSITIDSITVDGTGLLLFKKQVASSVALPLNPEWQRVSYKIYFGGKMVMLDVQYQINSFALAPDCEGINLYSITDATGVSVQEIFFTQRNITKNGSENIKLFF